MKRFTAIILFRYKHVTVFSALSTVVCFSLIVALLVLTRQAKMRYDAIQKFHRLQEYAGQVKTVSESLQALEENAQALEADVDQLKQIAQENIDLAGKPTSAPLDT
uniref:Uncharacterized protein n=1 Tax=Strigamia maritima TaxID=126957 RepID=T1J051_STRMM